MLKLKVLNGRREELVSDLESAAEIDQSKLFKLMYVSSVGTLNGSLIAQQTTEPIENCRRQ